MGWGGGQIKLTTRKGSTLSTQRRPGNRRSTQGYIYPAPVPGLSEEDRHNLKQGVIASLSTVLKPVVEENLKLTELAKQQSALQRNQDSRRSTQGYTYSVHCLNE